MLTRTMIAVVGSMTFWGAFFLPSLSVSAQFNAGAAMATEPYYSPALRASFQVEWMSMGQTEFVGARIVGIDRDSPLRRLHLQVGDVITHVDGAPAAMGLDWIPTVDGGYWALPVMEYQDGWTRISYLSARSSLRSGWVNLSSRFPAGPMRRR